MAADGKLKAWHYVMDGGITPYQLPWLLTRLIALPYPERMAQELREL